MEYKIGQIFEIDGIWYQFVEANRGICKGFVFYQSKIKCTNPDEDVKCSKWHREDGKSGHFVRLLPIGDVDEQVACVHRALVMFAGQDVLPAHSRLRTYGINCSGKNLFHFFAFKVLFVTLPLPTQ